MTFVGKILSDIYTHFFPEQSKEESPIQLYVGAKAQETFPERAKTKFAQLTFTPLTASMAEDAQMGLGSSRFKVAPIKGGKPFAKGFDVGVLFLMRSETHLGVARVIEDLQPFKEALTTMRRLSSSKVEVFVVDGVSSDSTIYDDFYAYVKSFNRVHQGAIAVGADLFGLTDFPGASSSQKPGIQFAGFDPENKPLAVIEYI